MKPIHRPLISRRSPAGRGERRAERAADRGHSRRAARPPRRRGGDDPVRAPGYRFIRYYQRSRAYVEKGAPHPLMRFVVAPVLVVSTIGVFATGVAILLLHQRHGIVVGLHKASFVFWFGAAGIHVLVYVRRLPLLLPYAR
jgi:hypothetical protein